MKWDAIAVVTVLRARRTGCFAQVVFMPTLLRKRTVLIWPMSRDLSVTKWWRGTRMFLSADRPTTDTQTGLWEDVKARERAEKGETRLLDGIARGLPPLLRALKLQKRAARVGFDWPELAQAIDKLQEEALELTAELNKTAPDQDRIKDEVGDLLFVAVNIARKAGIDPETALQHGNSKFEQRFNTIEDIVVSKHKNFQIDLDQMETSTGQKRGHMNPLTKPKLPPERIPNVYSTPP